MYSAFLISTFFQKRTRGVSSRDEEEVAKKNFKQAVAEAANKPSPGADVEVPMDLSMTGDEVDSSKALDGDVLMDTTVAGVEAASKPSLEEEKSKGTAVCAPYIYLHYREE